MQKYRTEMDLLGEVQVPLEMPYGPQTQRAIENYPLRGEKSFFDYPELLRAMLIIKKACALANIQSGCLAQKEGRTIMECVDMLLGELRAEFFPVHAFHGGGGISFNMNINEVLANLANKHGFDKPYGSYVPLHPNDHINLNQSTNDVFGSGCHLAIIEKWQTLSLKLEYLAAAFANLGKKYKGVQKISRTCLQDAVEIGFDDFFSGYSDFISRAATRISHAVEELFSINIGGTMVGRPMDADKGYLDKIIPALREVTGNSRYNNEVNFFDASQNLDDMVQVSTQLKLMAQGLIKIGKDLRLMASGPQAGFCEIELPAIQPGSSAFPGKVNPSDPEFLIQSCFMVIGRCSSAEMALEHGELDLNVWEATVVTNILDAMAAMENGVRIMRDRCVPGIIVNRERNEQNINSIIPFMTRLKNEKGYSFATRAYKESGGDLEKLITLLIDAK